MYKENSTEKIREELAAYWNYKRNGGFRPEDVKLNSSRVVWMKCPSGHEFTLSIRDFAMGRRCPYDCGRVGKLSERFPELAVEFDAEKNGFGSNEIEHTSKMPLWWKCPNGHSYKMTIESRRRKGCPICGKTN